MSYREVFARETPYSGITMAKLLICDECGVVIGDDFELLHSQVHEVD